MPKTPLQRYREREGLRSTDLARRSGVSARTIKRLESDHQSERDKVTEVTRYRVLNGLNEARREHEKPELTYDEVYGARKTEA
jgi:transcriptional regulator with XRE-family HTH domain